MQIARGFNDHFDRHGNPLHFSRPAKQDWTIGQVVNVGFLKGLTVVAKNDVAYLLRSAKGNEYRFQPHLGIERVN